MSVLVISPHMDDEALGCGGVIQRFEDVTVAFVTERVVDHRFTAGRRYVEYSGVDRAVEMTESARILGYEPVRLGFPLHQLDTFPIGELVGRLEELLVDVELVLSPGPSNDQDHNAIRRAVQALRRPHRYSGSLLEFYVWGCPDPFADAVLVPLSTEEANAKMAAMGRYATQVAPEGRADPLYPYSPESVRAYMAASGRLVHAEHAEAFTPVRLVPNAATARLFGG